MSLIGTVCRRRNLSKCSSSRTRSTIAARRLCTIRCVSCTTRLFVKQLCFCSKKHVNCEACCRQAPLPKTFFVRKTIKATYLNSRWQMDLKKLPYCRGYEYACNNVDCYSRLATGGPSSPSQPSQCARWFWTACSITGLLVFRRPTTGSSKIQPLPKWLMK